LDGEINYLLYLLTRLNIMKIALLITGLGMGGAENQVVNLADRFAALGHSVLIIGLTGKAVVLPKNSSVLVVCLGIGTTQFDFWFAYLHARRLLRVFKPDVVHSHMVHANLFARLLRLSVPMLRLICTAHSCYEGGFARMWAYRLTDFLADMNSNVSQEAADSSIRRGAVSPRKIMAVYNGIDCDRFRFDAMARAKLRATLNLPEGAYALLAVGRFTDAKDYPNLLTAFAALCSARNDCMLWIVGGGAQQPIFETQAKELGIAHKVVFLGMRRDVSALMSAADILVLSSAWEGFGLVVAEAMACERLVVATDAGGVREVIGDVGWLVQIRDSAKLASAIKSAMSIDAKERFARGRAGRERVTRLYSLDASVARWLEIYHGNFSA
jgi:glycosyltransferase involved in cell wall biosynthesis